MNNTNGIHVLTLKMKVPEGKFFGKLYEEEDGGYIWRDTEGNLPPPKIDTKKYFNGVNFQINNERRLSL